MHSSTEFYAFEANGVLREITPTDVDDGKWAQSFVLNEKLKQIQMNTDYVANDGKCKPAFMHKEQYGIYKLDGERLEICWHWEDFPKKFAPHHSIEVMERHHGPAPESKKPSSRPNKKNKVLGELIWDERLNWYEASVPFAKKGDPVRIYLNASEEKELKKVIARAEAIVGELATLDKKAKQAAVDDLLELKNDAWLDEDNDEEEVDAKEFKSKMRLEGISIYDDGSSEWYYADGDLFWGHTILMDLSKSGEFSNAHIAG